jgi:ABC-type uncharacterized transport system permease subunit
MILSFSSLDGGASSTALALGLPSLVALLAYAVAAALREGALGSLRTALAIGWLAHGMAIVVDIAGIGSDVPGARFGFAPALSLTLWFVLAVYGIESRFVPLPGVRRVLAVLGMLAVMLALVFPGELRPQAPTRWAPLHWVLGLVSYGLFGAAVLHAAMMSRAEARLRRKVVVPGATTPGVPLLRLERLTYRFVAAGFAVLSAALLLGAWFANPWRWDHKTVFSMLGWVVFAGLLAGRHAFGWRGPRATRWLYGGAGLLLLGYVGSRFVLEVLLQRGSPA